MCGIFGYANHKRPRPLREVVNIVLKGLQAIEYRGYDSAGMCIDSKDPAKPHVVRNVGNINALRSKIFSPEMASVIDMDAIVDDHIAIAHTRWATHGEVSLRNCHPHQSNNGEFTVVHNGMMSNYMTVKQFLTAEGFTFTSETDTEVICVLAEYLYAKENVKTFVDLAVRLSHMVEGAYALLIKSVHFPGEVIACRKGSPLVIGVRQEDGNGAVKKCNTYEALDGSEPTEVYFASDSNSFAEHTPNAIFLEDDDIVHLGKDGIKFLNAKQMDQQRLSREVKHLNVTLESLSKGKYEHYMLKEIYDQIETVVSSMRDRINYATAEVSFGGFRPQDIHSILCSRRLVFISCGTSLNSCIAVRPLFEELLPLPVVAENASDFLDRSPHVHRDDTCIFVSQSGETADTLMALKYCRESGALCVGITNVVGSSISRQTDFGTHINAGVEVGVASTKAYTSQVVVLTLVALLLSRDSVSAQPRRLEVAAALATLSETVSETLRLTSIPIEKLARELKECRSIIVMGRGYDYATCLEAALKIKEMSYVHTEGMNSGELKHGPMALVDENMTVIALCSHDKHFSKAKAAVQQVNARKGRVIVFTTQEDAELSNSSRQVVYVPKTVDCLQCLVNAIPFQLLAYYMALFRGNNVDCPRNLAKSVTV